MPDFQNFSTSLQKKALLVNFRPTRDELLLIAKAIVEKAPASIGELQHIVVSVCGPVEMMAMEGVDTSDLRLLLVLALQVTKQG